jgi:DNA-directed RNA polymerases I, II, and III subunit RPABC5
MLIPVRCFTCNKVLGHLWEDYMSKVQRQYQDLDQEQKNESLKFTMLNRDKIRNKTIEGKILDEMGLNKYCCRTIMISTVDLTTKV